MKEDENRNESQKDESHIPFAAGCGLGAAD